MCIRDSNYIYWAFLRVKKVGVTFLVHKHRIIMFLSWSRKLQLHWNFRPASETNPLKTKFSIRWRGTQPGAQLSLGWKSYTTMCKRCRDGFCFGGYVRRGGACKTLARKSRKLFGWEGILKSKPKILYWRLLFKNIPICLFSWYFVIITLKALQFFIIDINTANIKQFFGPSNYVYRHIR